jgi:uncharacterized protein (DUF58 family)
MLRNKIAYLFLIGYSIIFAILYDAYISALIVIVLVFLPIVLLVMMLCTFFLIKIEVYPPLESVGKDELIEFEIHIKNSSFLPIAYSEILLFYGIEFSEKKTRGKVAVFIDSRSEEIVKYRMTPEHCGNIIVEFKSIAIYDYLKIFSVKKAIKKQIMVVVLPALYEIESEFIPNMGMATESDEFSKIKQGDDSSEVFGIREYKEGDRINRINWKLSSKKGQLMIKEFSLPINCSLYILVELYFNGNKNKITTFRDALFSTVFSVSYSIISSGFRHYMLWYDKDREECIRCKIEKEEDLYWSVSQIMSAKTYKEKEIFLETYNNLYGTEEIFDIFYMSSIDTQASMKFIDDKVGSKLHVFHVDEEVKDVKGSFLG